MVGALFGPMWDLLEAIRSCMHFLRAKHSIPSFCVIGYLHLLKSGPEVMTFVLVLVYFGEQPKMMWMVNNLRVLVRGA